MNVLIACHAGSGIGLGHLIRSLVVARNLHETFNAEIEFFIQGPCINFQELKVYPHQFIDFNNDFFEIIKNNLARKEYQLIILDLFYDYIPENIDLILRELKQFDVKIIVIDSLKASKAVDLVFFPSFHIDESIQKKCTTPLLFGWDCFLLNVKKSPQDWKPGKNILALTGGSDTTSLGQTLPKRLDELLPNESVLHWVSGPFSKPPCFSEISNISIQHHRGLQGLDDLMVKVNYAITVYGVSFFELLYYGIPTVVFSPYGEKDVNELSAISREKVAVAAKDSDDAVLKLKELMSNDVLAKQLSLRSKMRLAILGGKKFAQAVSNLLEGQKV